MRIPGNKILRPAMNIREVAAPSAGNQYFFSYALAMLQDRHAPPAFPSLHGAQQTRRPAAQNNRIKLFGNHVQQK